MYDYPFSNQNVKISRVKEQRTLNKRSLFFFARHRVALKSFENREFFRVWHPIEKTWKVNYLKFLPNKPHRKKTRQYTCSFTNYQFRYINKHLKNICTLCITTTNNLNVLLILNMILIKMESFLISCPVFLSLLIPHDHLSHKNNIVSVKIC